MYINRPLYNCNLTIYIFQNPVTIIIIIIIERYSQDKNICVNVGNDIYAGIIYKYISRFINALVKCFQQYGFNDLRIVKLITGIITFEFAQARRHLSKVLICDRSDSNTLAVRGHATQTFILIFVENALNLLKVSDFSDISSLTLCHRIVF